MSCPNCNLGNFQDTICCDNDCNTLFCKFCKCECFLSNNIYIIGHDENCGESDCEILSSD